MNSATEHRTCPSCGAAIPANAPQGICPKCLMAAAVAMDTGPTGGKRPEPPSLERLAVAFPQLEVIEFIGQGGMGAVYKVRQKALDRVVALKVLPPGIGGDPAFAERFTREAKALAKLLHPNIVALFEFGQADGIYYLLMEFVDGVSLGQLLRSSRVSAREALAIVPQICDALQYAHDQGIVHRDIKPENILLDRRGRVKVADFGLAKLVEANAPRTPALSPADGERIAARSGEGTTPVLTEAGKIMGTPNYMAPEQREHPGEVDHRADIYALGVVFYQMLTGELPGKCMEPPSKKVQIDVRLDEVVLRALEKNPALRYQQVSDVKTCVKTIVSSGSAGVPPCELGAAPGRAERELKRGGIVLVGCRNGQRVIVWRGVANACFAILGCFLIATWVFRFFIPIGVEQLVIMALLFTALVTTGGVIMGIKTPVERLTPLDDLLPDGSRREEAHAGVAKPRQSWWTWSPLQSQEVGEICSHLTKAERNHLSVLGLLFAVWIPGTCFGLPVFLRSDLGSGKWIVALVWVVLFAVSIPMLQRMVRHFLCSTTWAKERGFAPEHLRLFSFGHGNLWKMCAVLAVGLVLVLAQPQAITSYLGLGRSPQPSPIEERHPRQASVQPATTFGPVIERVVYATTTDRDCFLDLETGRLLQPPPQVRSLFAATNWQQHYMHEPAATDPMRAWVWTSGADLVSGAPAFNDERGLVLLDGEMIGTQDYWKMGAVPVDKLLQETAATSQAGVPGTPSLIGAAPFVRADQRLRSHAFRTKDGTMGVLQVIGFTDNPRGVKLRYKLILARRDEGK